MPSIPCSTPKANGLPWVTTPVLAVLMSLSATLVAGSARADTRAPGHIEIPCASIANNNPIALDGTWAFYWQQTRLPQAWAPLEAPLPLHEQIRVPGTWVHNPQAAQTPWPHFGFATYVLHITLLGDCPEMLAVDFPSVDSAYEVHVLWPDGQSERVAHVGTYGETKAAAIQLRLPMVGPFKLRAFSELQLIVHVAKHAGAVGGIVTIPRLGPTRQLQADIQRSGQYRFFVLGILFFVGFYHLVLHLTRRRTLASLFFSLTCFIMAGRIFINQGYLALWLETPPSWFYDFRIRFAWGSYTILQPILYRYFMTLFPDEIPEKFYRFLIPTSALLLIPALRPDMHETYDLMKLNYVVTAMLCVFVVRGLHRAIRRGVPGARTLSVGIIVFLATGVSDILRIENLIELPVLAPIGFVIFVILNSHIISRRHARALETAEKLTQSLQSEVEKQTAELRVRTHEAEQAHEEAVKAQTEIAEINRNITENVLKRYLPPRLVDEILSGRRAVSEAPATMDITVLFADLVEFTTLSEQLGTHTIAGMLNEYLTSMADVVFVNEGTIDKFIGDSIMVLFGAPMESPPREQVQHAAACARQMRDRLADLNKAWGAKGLPVLSMRVGIHRGPALVGNLGSDRRSDYTAIGNTVNLASRIEGACTPDSIFMSESVATLIDNDEAESAGSFELKGIQGKTSLYKLRRAKVIDLVKSKKP